MYSLIFQLFLRRLDPERAHDLAMAAIRSVSVIGLGAVLSRFTRPDRSLGMQALGIWFDSPFGVAAGFDKDARAVIGLGQLGFGHIEVGTITALPQAGNDRPRLFRLVADRAVINRMGFNNDGAESALPRLEMLRRRRNRPVIGVNIGKSRVVDVADAVADYVTSARLLADQADYLVVNVSSPNTPGLRGLQELEQLAPLLTAVKGATVGTPLLVKIAPDLNDEEVRTVAQLVVTLGLDGIIATNTTLSRKRLASPADLVAAAGAGGLSGAPLYERSLEVLRQIRAVVPASLCVISVGGVETAAQVQERLDAGATLVQGYTGFIYHGPLWARRINRDLLALRRAR